MNRLLFRGLISNHLTIATGLVLYFLFFFTLLNAKTIVTGRMKNAALGDRIELYIPHHFIDNQGSSYKVLLDDQQTFTIEAMLKEPQVGFLIYGDDQLPVFLEPDDSLMIRSDMFQFPLTVVFGGKGGVNNRLLKEYLALTPNDFNEFNNVRFKIGQWWFAVESTVNEKMLELGIDDFRAWAADSKKSAYDLYDRYTEEQGASLTPAFKAWMEAEMTYTWAYQMLMYGQVYHNRYQVQDSFFTFLYEAPTLCSAISSDAYRQFLLALMARQQTRKGEVDRFYAGQYDAVGGLLDGKALAFFRSEIIRMAFSSDRIQEILPAYLDFLKNDKFPEYEPKITTIYERTSRLAPGAMVPFLEGTDFYTATNFSTKTLKNNVIYINFWATWCGACLKKMDFFNAFSPELEAAGVKIINISIDDDSADWANVLAETRMAGLNILAKNYPDQHTTLNFGVQAVPQYFIIARNGTIAEKPYTSHPEDIMKRLLELAGKQ